MSQPKPADEEQRDDLADRIPPEVLSRIFVFGNTLASACPKSNQLARFKDRIVEVCRYWREVALNTTRLWSHIIVTSKLPPLQALLDISRADHACSLDMNFDFITGAKNRFGSSREGAHSRIRRLLAQITASGATFDRWRSLCVMSKRIPDICAILGLVDGNMLALEALSIQLLLPPTSVHDQEIELGSPPLNDLLDLLARSPRLRTFQVTKFDYVTGKISSCFSSLKNITRLELMLCVAPVISDLRSLLLNNPHLETLAIEIDDPYATNRDALSLLRDDDTTSVILTRLQTLVLVEGVSMEGWSLRALQLIDAPSLISFRLDIDAWPAASECGAITEFLCSSNCRLITPTLRHLSLGLLRCSSDRFRELFALCPNLVRFDWVVEQNRRYSLILSHSPWLLPKLSCMRILGATLDVPLDYILIETVTERRKAELPLQVVEVGESHWIRLAAETKSHLQNVVERVRPFDDAPAMESRGMEGGEEDDEEEDSEEQDSEES